MTAEILARMRPTRGSKCQNVREVAEADIDLAAPAPVWARRIGI